MAESCGDAQDDRKRINPAIFAIEDSPSAQCNDTGKKRGDGVAESNLSKKPKNRADQCQHRCPPTVLAIEHGAPQVVDGGYGTGAGDHAYPDKARIGIAEKEVEKFCSVNV